jgi:hypothetical protein
MVDRQHQLLRSYGLSIAWVQRLEKGGALKAIVALTTFLSILCVAIILRHPSALNWIFE